MKKILIVNSNYYKKISKNLVINAKKKLLNKKYELSEIVKGDSIFCATGITSNEVLNGIRIDNKDFISETLVTHKSQNLKKIIKKISSINE